MGKLNNMQINDRTSVVTDKSLSSNGGVVTTGHVIGDGKDLIQGQNPCAQEVREIALKGAGVKSHPKLMNAHQQSSITEEDGHEAYLMDEMIKTPATYVGKNTGAGAVSGTPPTGPAVYQGGRSNPCSNQAHRK